jgi:membrane protease YdiL (CAAX protease family)
MPDDSPHTPTPVRPAAPVLRDLWAPERPIVLSGSLERQQFHPLLMALLAFIAGVSVYLLVSAVGMAAFGIWDAVRGAADPAAVDPYDVLDQISPATLLWANAAGQAAGFLVFILLLAQFHTPDARGFLRLRTPDGAGMGLALLGVIVAQPLVQWLGLMNQKIPLPQSVLDMEAEQMAMIENLLLGSDVGLGTALIVVAVVPALCEEVFFRGYLHRQVERVGGGLVAAVAVGTLFGLFHLRLTQALPLVALGIYFGVLVWATGSLWIPIAAHFLNNGAQVLFAFWAKEQPDFTPEQLGSVSIPWYLVVASVLGMAWIVNALAQRRRDRIESEKGMGTTPAGAA